MNSGSKLSGCQALLSVGSLLPPCLACLPSLCLPASLFSLSPSPSSSLPLPASVYLIDVGLGAAVLWRYLFGFLLDPLATGTKGELAAHGAAPAPEAWRMKGRKAGPLHPWLPVPAVSLFSHFARNAFELLPDPLSAVQMEFNALPWLDARSVRGGSNGTVSPPWRSISNLPCAMIIWVLDRASLPSSTHCLLYFSFIVPGISGSDIEAFQRGARQDSFWGEEGCTFWTVHVGLCFGHHPLVAAVWYTS